MIYFWNFICISSLQYLFSVPQWSVISQRERRDCSTHTRTHARTHTPAASAPCLVSSHQCVSLSLSSRTASCCLPAPPSHPTPSAVFLLTAAPASVHTCPVISGYLFIYLFMPRRRMTASTADKYVACHWTTGYMATTQDCARDKLVQGKKHKDNKPTLRTVYVTLKGLHATTHLV